MDHEPMFSSGPPGTRTPISWVQTKCLPLGPAARTSRGPSGSWTRPSSLPRRCAAETPTDRLHSDPGRTRTSTFLVVTQAPSPLGHGIMQVTGVGVEPTESPVSRTGRFSCLRTRSWRVWELHTGGPGLWGPAGHWPTRSCRPRYRTGHTGLMKASWAPAAPAMSDQGESRTPMPCGTTF